MKIYGMLPMVLAAYIVALTVGAVGIPSRAESATAQENLETLKQTNSCRNCDLSGLTISRMDLAGADLEGADFSKSKFSLTNLSGANLRNANLRGASFGGTDLGEADLRGADLRGTSLEGAYLENTLLDGKFVTAKPYEELGVSDVEKQVYVPNPEKPKKSPETREVNVAARPEAKDPPKKITAEAHKIVTPPAEKVATAAEKQLPAAPTAKKAVPLRPAIVEPQESSDQAMTAESSSTKKESTAKGPGTTAVTSAPTPDSLPKKTAVTSKPSPVPPAEVKTEAMPAVTTPAKNKAKGEAAAGELAPEDKSKRDKLAVLLKEDRCFGCDLSGLDLSGQNLKNVDLEKANLTGCKLGGANLDQANLKGAILQNADLRLASLKNADLYKADLSGADLSGANVQGAKFDNAKLTEAVGLGGAVK